jgi:hypothetical protein
MTALVQEVNQTFDKLSSILGSPEDVVPNHLEPNFYRQCLANLEVLRETLLSPSRESSFFVGAGISVFRPANMPLAADIIRELFTYAAQFSPDLKQDIEFVLKAMEKSQFLTLEGTLQHLLELFHPRPFYTPYLFNVPEIPPRYNLIHEFLARWLETKNGTVITTNLDPLIEQAWKKTIGISARKLTVIRRPLEFEDWLGRLGENPTLWKLHGSSDDPQSWAVTLSTVASELTDARAAFLKYILGHHNLCFVGWRAADLDVFPCIRRALADQTNASSPLIFWIFYSQNSCRTLQDYFEKEPNSHALFRNADTRFLPIVSTAEHLFAWLEQALFAISRDLPDPNLTYPIDYNWLKLDVHTAHEFGMRKLVGFVLRNLGEHDLSLRALDSAGEQAVERATQLFQEAAMTCLEQGSIVEARLRVEKAWRLFREIDDPLGQVWCQFGRVTIPLTGGRKVSLTDKMIAFVRLFRLQVEFEHLMPNPKWQDSPKLGVALCSYHKTKIVEQALARLGLVRLRPFRQYLLNRYQTLRQPFQAPGLATAHVDVLRRIAFLDAYDNPTVAVREMRNAIQLAKVVGAKTYRESLDDAIVLANKLNDSELLNFAMNERSK